MDLLGYLHSMISGAPAAPTQQWPSDMPINVPHRQVHQMQAAPQGDMEAVAKTKGFKNAAQMSAFYQRQREQTPTGVQPGGNQSLLDQALAIHPANILNHLLDRWGQAETEHR